MCPKKNFGSFVPCKDAFLSPRPLLLYIYYIYSNPTHRAKDTKKCAHPIAGQAHYAMIRAPGYSTLIFIGFPQCGQTKFAPASSSARRTAKGTPIMPAISCSLRKVGFPVMICETAPCVIPLFPFLSVISAASCSIVQPCFLILSFRLIIYNL